MKSTLNGKWNSPYVCELGIIFHCNEISVINNLILTKQAENENIVEETERLFDEIVDLKLIIDKYIEQNKLSYLIYQRETKFAEKEKLEEAFLKRG